MGNDSKDLVKYAEELGKKIGFLIAALNIPDEAKDAFMEIIADFSLAQLERLAGILETRLINDETGQIEDELRKELEKIRSDYFKEEKALNQETADKLKALL
ncbi:MAG: hypothetical protein WCW77_04275 [Patescibacteria group bacterium]|jgi:transcriptional regulator of heat shock response